MTNSTDPFGHFAPKAQQPAQTRRVSNFLEAFKDAASKKPAMVTMETAGDLRPGSELNVGAAVRMEEERKQVEKVRNKERMIARQKEEDERARFKARQEEVKKQIEALRKAILKILKSTQNVAGEIEKAAFEIPVDPGTYHLGFFERLKRSLEIIKKRLDDSASWMHVFNQRNKRTPFYWQQVKKSGTKYMMSQERTIAAAG